MPVAVGATPCRGLMRAKTTAETGGKIQHVLSVESVEHTIKRTLPEQGFAEMIHHTKAIKVCSFKVRPGEIETFCAHHESPPQVCFRAGVSSGGRHALLGIDGASPNPHVAVNATNKTAPKSAFCSYET